MNNMVVLESLNTSDTQKLDSLEKLWGLIVSNWGILIGFSSLIVQIILAIIALSALIVANKTWKSNKDNVRLQREAIERAYRPMMVAQYLPTSKVLEPLVLEVSNLGKSIARNVKVEFDPAIPLVTDEDAKINKEKGKGLPFLYIVNRVFIDKIFDTWVPGHKVRALLWKPVRGSITNEFSAHGLPYHQKITIIYEDDKGEKYKDSFTLTPAVALGENKENK